MEKMLTKLNYTMERYERDLTTYIKLRDEQQNRLNEGEHSTFMRGVIEGHIRWYNGKIEEKLEVIADLKGIKESVY